MSKTTRSRSPKSNPKTGGKLRKNNGGNPLKADAPDPALIGSPAHPIETDANADFSLINIDQPQLQRLTWLLHNTVAERKAFQQLHRWQIRLDDHATHRVGDDNWDELLSSLTQDSPIAVQADGNRSGPQSIEADWISQSYLALGASYLMPDLLKAYRQEDFRESIETTITQAGQFQLPCLSGGIQIWVEQVLAVELPLSLASGCSDFLEPDDWIDPAIGWMSAIIDDKLDSDGWPVSEILPYFGPLLASWIRSANLIEKTKNRLPKSISQLIKSAVRQMLRLTRSDRTLFFSPLDSIPLSATCWKTFKRFTDDETDRKLAKRVVDFSQISLVEENKMQKLPTTTKQERQNKKQKALVSASRRKGKKSSPRSRYRKIEPSSVSEYGCSGIMATDWHRGAPKIAFDYSRSGFALEMGHQRPLVVGNCFPSISFNQNACQPLDEFVMTCEHHDEDVDYVELQMPMTQQVTLVRQVLLVPHDDLIMLADRVTCSQPGEIAYECIWPLAGGIDVLPETETRELYLQWGDIQSLVIPASLPEWRVGKTSGRLDHSSIRQHDPVATAPPMQAASHPDGTTPNDRHPNDRCLLQLQESQTGVGLYVPLIFDLDPVRSRQKRTWRQLTLVESRELVNRDQGAAFRIQIGEQQWYFYQAIGSQGNRSFFGDNFNGEFVLSRFQKDGAKQELIRIE